MSCSARTQCGDATGGCDCGCAAPELCASSNPPGADTVHARLGGWRDFLHSALRGLGAQDAPALRLLGTREASDPAVALLDAWAVAADVLTFYRERLTQEGLLRTAQDEYALRELAALVGYRPRPGVAAGAHLAYLLDAAAADVEIPPGAKAQTVPAPGEQMQTFETSQRFVARAVWSQMLPRQTRPPTIDFADALLRPVLRLADTTLAVRPGESVLFAFHNGPGGSSPPGWQVLREVAAARTDIQGGFLELQLKPRPGLTPELAARLETMRDKLQDLAGADDKHARRLLDILASYLLGTSASAYFLHTTRGDEEPLTRADQVRQDLENSHADAEVLHAADALFDLLHDMGRLPPMPTRSARGSGIGDVAARAGRAATRQLASGTRLARDAGAALAARSEERLALLSGATPALSAALPAALDALAVSPTEARSVPAVYLLRTMASPFGAVAPPRMDPKDAGGVTLREHDIEEDEAQFVFLDTTYDAVTADSLVVFDRPAHLGRFPGLPDERHRGVARVRAVQAAARRAYAMSGKVSQLELVDTDGRTPVAIYPFAEAGGGDRRPDLFTMLRSTLYLLQSEPVTLAGEPLGRDVAGIQIELDRRIEGLQPGHWLIVSGERTDIRDANDRPLPGIQASELAMLRQAQYLASDAPGDTLHTVLQLQAPLAYTYARASAVVYGNVVAATHGEMVVEVLGSGDAGQAGQVFRPRRAPLTFVAANNTEGVAGTETLRVNDMRYERVESLLDAGPEARAYQLDVDPGGAALCFFGDGLHGARLPSGSQNVRAAYRVGLGRAGNVTAGQISLLTTRPLGVTGVLNPLPADGGADPDGTRQIRRNAPLPALALSPGSRLVSVEDHAVFARRFAGIGQASAVRLGDGMRQVVHVTVVGVDDAPLDAEGALLQNLAAAFERYGDPSLPVVLAPREGVTLVLQARIGLDPAADWEAVEPALRRRLLAAFGAQERRIGQPAYLSEVVAVIQGTAGVAWSDVERFHGLSETQVGTEPDGPLQVDASLQARVDAALARADPQWSAESGSSPLRPAQLAALLPALPGLLALNLA